MKQLTIPELQNYLFTSLVAFDTYCRRHDIRYSLCGGTLIGAVRHQGFIPWDDDADVMLLRSEYDKLSAAWHSDPMPGYTLLTDRTENNFFAGESGKWFATETAPSQPTADNDIGLFLDIFVADPLPDEEAVARKYFRSVHFAGARFHTLGKRRRRPLWKIAQKLLPFLHPDYYLHRMQSLLAEYADVPTKYVAFLLGSSKDLQRELIPRHYFDSFIELPFGNHSFPVIAEYDAYLRHYYGDYMQLPPEEERLSYHTRNHILKH